VGELKVKADSPKHLVSLRFATGLMYTGFLITRRAFLSREISETTRGTGFRVNKKHKANESDVSTAGIMVRLYVALVITLCTVRLCYKGQTKFRRSRVHSRTDTVDREGILRNTRLSDRIQGFHDISAY